MTDALRSARLKLKRANVHVGAAKRETVRFVKSHPQPTFRAEPDGDPGPVRVGDTFRFRQVVETGYPDLPDSFAARFGDIIHNYRCVLDHIAWQLVLAGTDPGATSDPKRFRQIQFPIRTEQTKFTVTFPNCLPGVSHAVIQYIEGLHSYERGNATNHTLLAIADLSNEDKHQAIKPTFAAFSGIQHQWRLRNCKPVRFDPPPQLPEVKSGTPIGTVTCLCTGRDPYVEMDLTPEIQVVLQDGGNMFGIIRDIRDQIIQILDAPEIAAALK